MWVFQDPHLTSIIYHLGTMLFYLVSVQAKCHTIFEMNSLNRNEKVRCQDCSKTYKCQKASRNSRVVREELFLARNLFILLTTSKKGTSKKHVSSTRKVNRVCIVMERILELLITSTTSHERSRVESEKNEQFSC